MKISRTSTEKPKLKNQIESLLDRLPLQDFTRPVVNEVDFYGASHLIAEIIGLKQAPCSLTTWSHGYHRKETLPILISHEQRREQINFVRCERHAQILRAASSPYAMAVGMPYLYALKYPIQQAPRISGSLLFMPAHTLPDLKKESDEESYLTVLLEHRHHFSQIVACLHPSCIENGYWVDRLEKADIPWIVGSLNTDTNSLRRMHTLFSSFEYMATTAFGSHVAYATATGCKVSFIGKIFCIAQRKTLITNPFYRNNPEAIDYVLKYNNPEDIRKEYSQFFTAPKNATDQTAWGLEAIGEPAQRLPEEIARLLGWQYSDDDTFQNIPFKKLAPVLGFCANNTAPLEKMTRELTELKGRNVWLEEKRKEAKLNAKEKTKLAKKTQQKLERSQSDYQKIRKSIAWKLARPLHSIEKRIRKIY